MTSTHFTDSKPAGARLATLAVIMMACTPATSPSTIPAGAVSYHPPADYQTWWERTEACAGLQGNFAGISWYIVPGADHMDTEIGQKVGLWQRDNGHSTITIAGNYRDSELVVRHEMLHDLLSRAGHPEEYFVDRCGLTWDSWHPQADLGQ